LSSSLSSSAFLPPFTVLPLATGFLAVLAFLVFFFFFCPFFTDSSPSRKARIRLIKSPFLPFVLISCSLQ